jgi:hypothetical protein
MSYVEYVATESVMVGHLASITYGFEFQVTRADRSVEQLRSGQRSLSGKREVLFFGQIVRWEVVMFPIPAIEADLYREFLDSVADGQVFTFDPYGTRDAPVRALAVELDDDSYTERRVTITGDPEYSDYLEFSFRVSEHHP